MPTLSAEDRLIPKSTLRHRPLSTENPPLCTPTVQRASRNQPQQPMTRAPKRRAATMKRTSQPRHRMVPVGITMTLTVIAVWLIQVISQWGTGISNDLHYGYPRTFQVDAFVGQEASTTPSHFIALNLHGRVEVIELPAGDATQAHIFLGPQLVGPNADLVPVTLQFVNLHHDPHHPDMLVLFGGTQMTFRNQNGTFTPLS